MRIFPCFSCSWKYRSRLENGPKCEAGIFPNIAKDVTLVCWPADPGCATFSDFTVSAFSVLLRFADSGCATLLDFGDIAAGLFGLCKAAFVTIWSNELPAIHEYSGDLCISMICVPLFMIVYQDGIFGILETINMSILGKQIGIWPISTPLKWQQIAPSSHKFATWPYKSFECQLICKHGWNFSMNAIPQGTFLVMLQKVVVWCSSVNPFVILIQLHETIQDEGVCMLFWPTLTKKFSTSALFKITATVTCHQNVNSDS